MYFHVFTCAVLNNSKNANLPATCTGSASAWQDRNCAVSLCFSCGYDGPSLSGSLQTLCCKFRISPKKPSYRSSVCTGEVVAITTLKSKGIRRNPRIRIAGKTCKTRPASGEEPGRRFKVRLHRMTANLAAPQLWPQEYHCRNQSLETADSTACLLQLTWPFWRDRDTIPPFRPMYLSPRSSFCELRNFGAGMRMRWRGHAGILPMQ